jgi:hypothetical protein
VHWPQICWTELEDSDSGALMNTRLMELIVIGLELKVLTPEVFTMMVVMAGPLTGPALDLINYLFKSKVVLMPKK